MEIKEFVNNMKMSKAQFCREAQITMPTLYRLLAGGKVKRCTAIRISSMTQGQVAVESMEKTTRDE